MKNAIFAILLLVVITLSCVLGINYTKKTSTALLDTLDMCAEAVQSDNWQLSMQHIELANALWRRYHPALAMFLQHRDLAEISDSLSRVSALLRVRDKSGFTVERDCLCELIFELGKSDSLTFENLF